MEGMDSGMSSNESDDDIDEDEDLGVDMDGYPSDDDIDGEIEDEDAEAVDPEVEEAIAGEDDYQRIESELAQKQSERRLAADIVDEVLDDEYPGNDLEESDDIIKESLGDIREQVAQGRLNFNNIGKDSSI